MGYALTTAGRAILDSEDHRHGIEGRALDRKSLRLVTGRTANFNELAKESPTRDDD